MRKALCIMAACVIALGVVACKKKGPGRIELAPAGARAWLEGRLSDAGGKRVLWFQVFDQKDNKQIIDSYRDAAGKVDAYPAKIHADKWIWMMVNNRFEIRLIADEKSDEYRKTDKLKDYIKTFDLAGMAKYDGPVLKGKDLERFVPKQEAN